MRAATQALLLLLVSILTIDARASVSNPMPETLTAEISARLSRITEIRFIQKKAKELGIRVWLFGGTAASYAHYVRWNLLQEAGDPRFQPDRFDYDYTNIFRSTQDLDLVVDTRDGRDDPGLAERAKELQRALANEFPHLQGSKSVWEVRLLRTSLGDKEAILANPDFANQHTDSHSTGLIEVTAPPPGQPAVRDSRDWNAPFPEFLKDVVHGKLHYYYSEGHERTRRAIAGLNPPIFSVIRYLTKAFQYELEIAPEDLAKIREVIARFDPSRDLEKPYAKGWIEKNGKKLIQNAVDVSYATRTLDQLGLRDALAQLSSPSKADSLGWWMRKEALHPLTIGQGAGKTAVELGIRIVAHETKSMHAYESITRATTGVPNVLISRSGHVDEAAAHGEGFYTQEGRTGARGTGLTIRFEVDPAAREGTDFVIAGGTTRFVIFRNRQALRVIPESLKIGVVEYFDLLARGALGIDGTDRALLEKFRRKIDARLRAKSSEAALSEAETASLLGIARAQTASPSFNLTFWEAWFASPFSLHYPEIMLELLDRRIESCVYVSKLINPSHEAEAPSPWKDFVKEPRNRKMVEKLRAETKFALLRAARDPSSPLRGNPTFWEHWIAWPESIHHVRHFERALLSKHTELGLSIEELTLMLDKQPHWRKAITEERQLRAPPPTGEEGLLWTVSRMPDPSLDDNLAEAYRSSGSPFMRQAGLRMIIKDLAPGQALPAFAYHVILDYLRDYRNSWDLTSHDLEVLFLKRVAARQANPGRLSRLAETYEAAIVIHKGTDALVNHGIKLSALQDELAQSFPQATWLLERTDPKFFHQVLERSARPRELALALWRDDSRSAWHRFFNPKSGPYIGSVQADALGWLAAPESPGGPPRAYQNPEFLREFFGQEAMWGAYFLAQNANRLESIVQVAAPEKSDPKENPRKADHMALILAQAPATPEVASILHEALGATGVSKTPEFLATVLGTVFSSPQWRRTAEARHWAELALHSGQGRKDAAWTSKLELFSHSLFSDGPLPTEWQPTARKLIDAGYVSEANPPTTAICLQHALSGH